MDADCVTVTQCLIIIHVCFLCLLSDYLLLLIFLIFLILCVTGADLRCDLCSSVDVQVVYCRPSSQLYFYCFLFCVSISHSDMGLM